MFVNKQVAHIFICSVALKSTHDLTTSLGPYAAAENNFSRDASSASVAEPRANKGTGEVEVEGCTGNSVHKLTRSSLFFFVMEIPGDSQSLFQDIFY